MCAVKTQPGARAGSRRPWARVTAALLAALALLAAPAAVLAADNTSADAAALLAPEQSGSLPGGMGGHFAYYRFGYPGGWPVQIELDPYTTDKNVLQYVGMKLYGPQPGHEYADAKLEDGVWRGTIDVFTHERGEFVVQVYNYYPDRNWALGFTLLATNLPPQTGEEGAMPAPGSAGHVAIPVEGVETGRLVPKDGGEFRYYSFYAGRGQTVTVNMQVSPDQAGVLAVAGFKLYGPQLGREYLQSEAQAHRTPNQTATLWVDQDGLYVIQVYNYSRDVPIDYQLWIAGPD